MPHIGRGRSNISVGIENGANAFRKIKIGRLFISPDRSKINGVRLPNFGRQVWPAMGRLSVGTVQRSLYTFRVFPLHHDLSIPVSFRPCGAAQCHCLSGFQAASFSSHRRRDSCFDCFNPHCGCFPCPRAQKLRTCRAETLLNMALAFENGGYDYWRCERGTVYRHSDA